MIDDRRGKQTYLVNAVNECDVTSDFFNRHRER
jgi:hypothetical protein